ncbi:MAG: YgeY family selenium metabolism-linked hydrolase [Enterobacteriaceae bacterium]
MTITSERQNEVVQTCQSLIRIQSYSGAEQGVVNFIEKLMQQYGFDEIHRDRYGNLVGGFIGKQPGKTLLLDGHVDTVPASAETWSKDPFGGELVDGKIYGRGSSDMKGAVSAMLSAAAFFAKDSQRQFAGKIYVACGVHEECFEGIAASEISARYRPDYVIIGEASALNIKLGQRGRAEIVVETFGKPAHSATPQTGINAVYQMTRLVERIRLLKAPEHPQLGQGILELTDIKSSPWPGASVVPDYCRSTWDRRLLTGESRESVLAPLQAIIDELKGEDSTFNAAVSYATGSELCYTGAEIKGERFFPAWLCDQQSELVQTALKGLQQADIDAQLSCWPFCTNGSHYAGELGIATMGFGPSREDQAHTIDEYIEVDQLIKATQGYYAIIHALSKTDSAFNR